MQRLLLILSAALAVSALDVTPIQKVIQLMTSMQKKGTKEMQEEQSQYAKYKVFCDDTLKEKATSIEEAAEKMEVLETDIQHAKNEQIRLHNEMVEHQSDISKYEAEKDEATSVRKQARADFQETHKDYTESVDAIERARTALKENAAKVSLVQLESVKRIKSLPEDALAGINAYINARTPATTAAEEASPSTASFLMEDASTGETQAPAPDKFESSSGGVIAMLDSLMDKFFGERVQLEKEEQQQVHAYEMLIQRLDNQIKQSKKELRQKTELKAKNAQAQAAGESELSETTTDRASDMKYHSDLKKTCAKKAADFDIRQTTRKEELEAIAKAISIISGSIVSKGEEKRTSFLQTRSSTSLAFLREPKPDVQARVAEFLQKAGAELGSRMLQAVAVRANADGLGKVKRMVSQLINKLRDEAIAEASEKAFCDTELAQNKVTRNEHSDNVDSLTAEIDQLKAFERQLGEEVATLTKEISELNTAITTETELREKEKAENLATIKDAKEAKAAVANALRVLKDFYESAADARSFLQVSSSSLEVEGQPEVFGNKPYQGRADESGGVIGLLEVIETDFARLGAETTAAEAAAKKEFEDFLQESGVNKATKMTTEENKLKKKKRTERDISQLEGDLLGTQKELDAANDYFEKLKPKCLDQGPSFSERKKLREQEIKNLEEALGQLGGLGGA